MIDLSSAREPTPNAGPLALLSRPCQAPHTGHASAAPFGAVAYYALLLANPGTSLAPSPMSICQPHNLAHSLPRPEDCHYGIRVSLRSSDPFRNLIGSEWSKEHWYLTSRERDEALAKMSQRYVYFRPGDTPALDFEVVERL